MGEEKKKHIRGSFVPPAELDRQQTSSNTSRNVATESFRARAVRGAAFCLDDFSDSCGCGGKDGGERGNG